MRLRDHLAALILAVQFLTRLPIRADVYTADRMARAPQWFGAVGLLTGGAMAAVLSLAALFLPIGVAIVLSVIAGIWITGALHEDGFADTCDGLGGGRTPARALEIMRDSRIGAYGALGLMLLLTLKLVTLWSISVAEGPGQANALRVAGVLIAGQSLSRVIMTVAMSTGQYLRKDGGAGAAMVQPMAPAGWVVLAVSAAGAGAVGAFVLPIGAIVVGGVAALAAFAVLRRMYVRRLGGHTGDLLGGVQQVSEAAFYLGVLAWL